MSGFILGFDHEQPGAGQRIVDFIQETGIPQGQFSLLQALQNTQMWNRLKQENRLKDGMGTFHQGAIMNFIPRDHAIDTLAILETIVGDRTVETKIAV
jgi:hypothetical protein